jgi:hypothetical protein
VLGAAVSQALDRVGLSGWDQYAELARELDAVRAAEAARTDGVRQAAAEMTGRADELETRLREQGTNLSQLGRRLRLRVPKLAPEKTEAVTEPAPEISRIADLMATADREATEAADRGRYPALLPRWPAGARNLLIYGVAAGLVIIAQMVSFFRSDLGSDQPDVGSGSGPNALVVLFVIPLIGWVVGYLLASAAGRTRLEEDQVKTSPKLGFLLCFGIGPVIVVALMVHSFTSR